MHHLPQLKRLSALLLAAVLLAALPFRAFAGAGGVGMDLSGLSSVTFAGDPVDGSIFYGSELTVINIWQRWCGPCWSEMPAFQELHEYYSATPEADVRVWGALYYGTDPSQIQQAIDFVADHGFTWDQMLMCDALLMAATEGDPEVEYFHIPQTLIVDRCGRIREQVIGSISDHDELFALVGGWLETLRAEYAAEAGDVDASGTVDVVDALLVMRCSMSVIELTPVQLARADVDGDGEVSVSDALLIMRITMGVH